MYFLTDERSYKKQMVLKNSRVSAGDLVYVKGYELEGSAKVSVSAVEGKVDGSIVGETVIVENLARKLVKIQSCT